MTRRGIAVDRDAVGRWRGYVGDCAAGLEPGILNRGYAYTDTVEPADAGRTALAYYSTRYTHSDADSWRARFAQGEIRRGDVSIPADTTLAAGDELRWDRPPWREPAAPSEFTIVHHDAEVLVVDKPPCLPMTPAGGYLEQTLVAHVRRRFPDLPEVAPIHRLGRGTSGVVVFGTTRLACAALSRQLREGAWEKDYLALVRGVVAFDSQAVDAPIGPVPHPTLGMVQAVSEDGKLARSDLAVVWTDPAEDVSLLTVRIHTGRTQQVRIHAAVAGHPLVGDDLYVVGGRIAVTDGIAGRPGDVGYILHAARVRLVQPVTGGGMEFVAALPGSE